MCKFLRKLRELCGYHDEGYEYYVNLNEIIIKADFLCHPPGRQKMKQKEEYYSNTGEFDSRILLSRDFVLKDGYTSYLVARKHGLKQVPVYFVGGDEQ